MDPKILLVILLGLLAICLVASIIMRAVRVCIVIAILIFVVPIFCTILFGDGTEYVSGFADQVGGEVGETINETYEYYYNKNQEDPVIEMTQLEKFADAIMGKARNFLDRFLNGGEGEVQTPAPTESPGDTWSTTVFEPTGGGG